MKPSTKTVISASRRTDIPAFYMDWFMAQIGKGVFEVINPYHRQVTIVPATPETVHTIVFWSKDFGPFIDGNFGEQLMKMGYHLYFSFTINSDAPELEPMMPPLKARLDQLKYLCSHFSPEWIDWRFDPLCFYQTENGNRHDNLHDLTRIAEAAARLGIRRCITSFMDHYAKIRKRVKPSFGFSFYDPTLEQKKDIVLNMKKTLNADNIQLYLCCEKELLETLPSAADIRQSVCIPNHRLKELFGGNPSLIRDRGQRIKHGCGCRVSVDIGSYHLHPCFHNCLFCYANPTSDDRILKQSLNKEGEKVLQNR